MQNIFDKKFREYTYLMKEGQGRGGPVPEQSEGRAQPGPSRPCPAPIRSITEIFIKNILHSHIFPGHSSSLMTLIYTVHNKSFAGCKSLQRLPR